MRFWSREITGWFLVGIGLYTFFLCYEFLLRGQIWEAGPMCVIGIFVFRGGIHLVKVALAARVCLEAQEQQKERRLPKGQALPSRQRASFAAPRRF